MAPKKTAKSETKPAAHHAANTAVSAGLTHAAIGI